MHYRSNNKLIEIVVSVSVIAGALFFWKASILLNLSIGVTIWIIVAPMALIGGNFYLISFIKNSSWELPLQVSFWTSLPLLLTILWIFIWPALDCWVANVNLDNFENIQYAQIASSSLSKFLGVFLLLSLYFFPFFRRKA